MTHRFFSKACFALPALAAAWILGGCTRDRIDPVVPDPDTGREVTITVTIPSTETPTTRSIAGADGEAKVTALDILVFEDGGSGTPYVLSEHVPGEIVSQSASETDHYKVQFRARLKANANARSVAVVANAAAAVDEVVNAGGVSGAALGSGKPDILRALTFAMATPGGWNATGPSNFTPLPMYGEKSVPAITNGMKIDGVDLIRMLARIDVVNSAPGFDLQKVYLVNYNAAGYIAPAWNTVSGELYTRSDAAYPYSNNLNPALPANPAAQPGESNAVEYDYAALATSAGMLGEIYAFEALATTGAEGTPGHTNAVCLILQGEYKGTPYYYRADFTAGTDTRGEAPWIDNDNDGIPDALNPAFDPFSVEYMPVYRNFRYTFTIGAVNGAGYPGFGEALGSLGVMNNLKTEMLAVDISGIKNTVFDDKHYLGISTPEVALDYLGGGTENIQMATNYAYGWKIDTDKGVNGIEYTDSGDTGWLTTQADPAAADARYADLIVTTPGDNPGITDRTAYVHLKAGTLTHKVMVTQKCLYLVNPSLSVTPPSADFPYQGGTETFGVESLAEITTYTGVTPGAPIPWKAEFSEDGGLSWSSAAPAWLTSFDANGNGGPAATYTAQAAAFPKVEIYPDALLKAARPEGSSSSPYHLPTHGGRANLNTANCYIVNAPGHYRFPLVYGNAIKDGWPNPSAYAPSAAASGTTYLTPFVRDDNNPITGPYIYNQFTPDKAVVVWQDAQDLVTNVDLADGGTSISFEVAQGTIRQGNAVLAVRSGNTILWSWHIWVTPLVNAAAPVLDEVRNHEGHIYRFMQYNLGWCAIGPITTYGTEARSVQVRITQTGIDNPLSETFTVIQDNGIVMTGYGPYWQWGRKDPMPPSDGAGNERTLYGTYNYSVNSNRVQLGAGIRSPYTFYGSASSWSASIANNLWSANNTGTAANDLPVVKTVYDPSPVGFVMPASNAWSGFSGTGANYPPLSEYNVSGPWNKGWLFYLYSRTDGDYKLRGKTFYPATGRRDMHSGGVMDEGTVGSMWYALPNLDIAGQRLWFTETALFRNGRNRSEGLAVRPVRDGL